MMTATIVDDLTDTSSDKNRECKGQGVANIASRIYGWYGWLRHDWTIDYQCKNLVVVSDYQLFCAGIFLLIMVVFISDWLKVIPMAALVAVMIMVSILEHSTGFTQKYSSVSPSQVIS